MCRNGRILTEFYSHIIFFMASDMKIFIRNEKRFIVLNHCFLHPIRTKGLMEVYHYWS